MVQKIVWTPKAIETYDSVINYLLTNFSEKEAERFTDLIQNKLSLIRAYPLMFRPTANLRNTFRTVIHKRVVLVYQYKPRKKEVQLLHFWSTWMNPQKFKY